MKKSTLALSIAAAIGSFGLASTASAAMSLNADGVGHQLVFPYFTAQGDNATLLSITNTDTTNGKLVKVRFRGAANSDDLYDFQVLLSPGDVWTAAVSKDATTGLAKLATTDKSCTLPQSVSATFSTARLDPSASADAKASGTREGYVEVINMGDIQPLATGTAASTVATALFTTLKHVAGVAPCASAVLQEKLGTAFTSPFIGEKGLSTPTGGLTGDYIILNQANTAAWSGSATALKAANPQVVFWPQKSGDVTLPSTNTYTADPLFTGGNTGTPVIVPQNFDLPDMSTQYDTGNATAVAQADDTTGKLAVKSIANQFVTSDDIAAVTDWVFAQPTRRYHVAVNYTAIPEDAATSATELNNTAKTGTKAVAIYRDTSASGAGGASSASSYYMSSNMGFPTGSRTLCLKNIDAPGRNARFDREETTPATAAATDFTISPVVPAATATVYICGEAAVLSINNGGTETDSALSASVARNDLTFAAGYENGWMRFDSLNGTTGLPILGASFIRMANGAVNYGVSYSHKVTR